MHNFGYWSRIYNRLVWAHHIFT